MVKFIDLFCGAGGAAEGLIQAGFECVLAVDNEGDAVDSHKANHPDVEVIQGDLTDIDIDWSSYQGEVDFVWGSPPCQANGTSGTS